MIKKKPNEGGGYFLKNISNEQSKDTGMAMVLICLLLAYFYSDKFVAVSIILLLVDMTVPRVYRPVAIVWLGFSTLLGTIMTKVLLTIIFFTLVTPVGIVRRMLRADSLQLRKWKKDNSSVFQIRDHEYQPEDVDKPY